MDSMKIVEATWEELGFKVSGRSWYVWVRTDPVPGKIGSIWLPNTSGTFWGDYGNRRLQCATVLSAGPRGLAAEFKPGDRICFQRLYFAYQWVLKDGTRVGYVDANQVTGFVDGEGPDDGFFQITEPAKTPSLPV